MGRPPKYPTCQGRGSPDVYASAPGPGEGVIHEGDPAAVVVAAGGAARPRLGLGPAADGGQTGAAEAAREQSVAHRGLLDSTVNVRRIDGRSGMTGGSSVGARGSSDKPAQSKTGRG